MVNTCSSSYSGGWGRRIAWTCEVEVAVSQDHSHCTPDWWLSETPSQTNKQTKKETCLQQIYWMEVYSQPSSSSYFSSSSSWSLSSSALSPLTPWVSPDLGYWLWGCSRQQFLTPFSGSNVPWKEREPQGETYSEKCISGLRVRENWIFIMIILPQTWSSETFWF